VVVVRILLMLLFALICVFLGILDLIIWNSSLIFLFCTGGSAALCIQSCFFSFKLLGMRSFCVASPWIDDEARDGLDLTFSLKSGSGTSSLVSTF